MEITDKLCVCIYREHLLANNDATMKISEYGTILKSGSGSDPDEETVDYITDAMNGKMNLDKWVHSEEHF